MKGVWVVKEVYLPAMEMLKALYKHRVSIQYSTETDDLSVCPVEGPYQGKCLDRLGLAQVLDAEIYIENGKFRVIGDLRNCAQKNVEYLKTYQPPNKYEFLDSDTVAMWAGIRYPEVLVFKDRVYRLSGADVTGST